MVAPLVMAAGLSGGLSALSSIAGGALSAQSSWKKQKKMFRWQKAWEKEKMQNAYQWTVDDMQKAGLNPALGYSQGPTSSGGAPSASAPQPDYSGVGSSIEQALNFYNSARQVDSQIGVNNSAIGKTEAETAGQILNNELVAKYGDPQKKAEVANTLMDTANKSANTAKAVEEKNRIRGGKLAETTGTVVSEKILKDMEKEADQNGSLSAQGYKKRLGGLIWTRSR